MVEQVEVVLGIKMLEKSTLQKNNDNANANLRCHRCLHLQVGMLHHHHHRKPMLLLMLLLRRRRHRRRLRLRVGMLFGSLFG